MQLSRFLLDSDADGLVKATITSFLCWLRGARPRPFSWSHHPQASRGGNLNEPAGDRRGETLDLLSRAGRGVKDPENTSPPTVPPCDVSYHTRKNIEIKL